MKRSRKEQKGLRKGNEKMRDRKDREMDGWKCAMKGRNDENREWYGC